MNKNERRETFLAIGFVVLFLGSITIYNVATKPWTLEVVASNVGQTILGGFLVIIGAWCCAWGVSDEAGKDASEFLRYIWNRFLKALGR